MKKLQPASRVISLARSRYRAKAWKYAARAQVMRDPNQRAEYLRFSGMWLTLTEPSDEEIRSTYEWPRTQLSD
jgi:hypothetical protein